MTREEAIAVIKQHGFKNDWDADWIDRFAALGMLKLDEPKSARAKAGEIIDNYLRCDDAQNFWDDMDEFGLKIVEK